TRRIYSKDYVIGYEKTKKALWEVDTDNFPVILEIACGRGTFFKQFIRSRQGSEVYVATDFSLSVLQSDLRWLRKNGLSEQVTLMAFDAKAMPFRDSSVSAMVSNVGFPNIRNGDDAVNEAFRTLTPDGILVTNFMFTSEQTRNYAKAKELGLDQFYIRKSTEEVFRKAGFEVDLHELYRGEVRPTPGGIDGLPIVPDTYSFCVLKARKPAIA
ncbi:MAG: class I SAM-dependent methyltransferase, partial [Candidatus Bathyarchaeota archaeon]|nr:class I SAM-dependent methyltransferase [Candidatus Bathyarchaeota archaeon]